MLTMRSVDPVIKLLAMLMVFFTACLFYSEHMFRNDGQIFQVVSNILSGIAGALLMGIRRDLGLPEDGASTTLTRSVSVQTVPASSVSDKEPA